MPRRRNEETPGARAERERRARAAESMRAWRAANPEKSREASRNYKRKLRERRAAEQAERAEQDERERQYDRWIQTYGSRDAKQDLARRRRSRDPDARRPNEQSVRRWWETEGSQGWVGRPEPRSRRQQHQRRWVNQQQNDGKIFGGGADGLIGEQGPGGGAGGRGRGGAGGRPASDAGNGLIGGGMEALRGKQPDPPDEGKDDGPRDGKLW